MKSFSKFVRIFARSPSRRLAAAPPCFASAPGLLQQRLCLPLTGRSRWLTSSAIMMLAHHSGRVPELPPTVHALVIGGSGAVGRCVVAQLAADHTISKITCINRREWALPALSIGEDKLHHVICNIESEKELSAAVCLLADQSVSVAYCTLGTTRRFSFACCRRFSSVHYRYSCVISFPCSPPPFPLPFRDDGSSEALRTVDLQ